MITTPLTGEKKALTAEKAHSKAMDALLKIRPPKGIRLVDEGNCHTLITSGKGWVSGLILMLIAAGFGFLQYHTSKFIFQNSESFHIALWFLIGLSLVMGIPFLFQRHRIRLYADRIVFSKPIFGLGLPITIFWSEVKAIGKGASVAWQNQIPLPHRMVSASTSLGEQGVASIIRIKSTGGDLSFGSSLSSLKRSYLIAALIAYYKAWRAATEEGPSQHIAAPSPD